jgi:hypothetical protein
VRLTVRLDEQTLDETVLTSPHLDREYRTTGSGRPVTLEISVDRALPPAAGEPRELALRFETISWGPVS